MKQYLLTVLSAVILCFIYSCKKNITTETPVAIINITAPSEGGMVSRNDSVAITGSVAVSSSAPAAQTLHGYDIVIRKAGDTTKLFFTHAHAHGTSLLINHKWFNDQAANTQLELETKVYTDHDGTSISKFTRFASN